MKYTKHFFLFAFPLLIVAFQGCTTVKYYPVNFVESLKHPTKFPEVFSFTVQNIEEIAAKNPLSENEDTRVTDVGENKNSSMHLVQIRENGELHPHYHKRHDEVIYIKKGSGIATLDGTRYMVKPGSIVQIPSKTIHKFLNTGEEPLIAISIFSPPFDGRDEKTIRKKRADRHKKEERRLADKKHEKTAEEDKNPDVNEPLEEETQVATSKPKKVLEKKLNNPVGNEWEADYEESSPPPKEPSASRSNRDKKKTKEARAVEEPEPTINIRDLHEKLTKLVELKEEGTITEEEYEKKKDALVKGRDVGDLPGAKGSAKKKPFIEDDDEPILEQTDKDISTEENIFDENQDTVTGDPYLSSEDKITTREIGPGERTPLPSDKLKTLEELWQEDLITEEEFEEKRKGLIGALEEESDPVSSKNAIENEKVLELDELYDEGLITEEDYESKRKELLNEEETTSLPPKEFTDDDRIGELRDLYNEGLITEDDYKYKIRELSDTQKQKSFPNVIPGEKMNDDMLTELNELKEEGLISEEDYEFKKAQLLDN